MKYVLGETRVSLCLTPATIQGNRSIEYWMYRIPNGHRKKVNFSGALSVWREGGESKVTELGEVQYVEGFGSCLASVL